MYGEFYRYRTILEGSDVSDRECTYVELFNWYGYDDNWSVQFNKKHDGGSCFIRMSYDQFLSIKTFFEAKMKEKFNGNVTTIPVSLVDEEDK